MKRTTEPIEHREGGEPSQMRKSPGRTSVAIEHIKLDNEGWQRDHDVVEPVEPSYTDPSS